MQTPQEKEIVENLKSHLKMIRSMKESEADDEFYKLLENAKSRFGDVHPQMAYFYLCYASFLLTKMQNSIDVLNAGAVPEEHQNEDEMDQIQEAFEDEEDELDNSAQKDNIEKVQLLLIEQSCQGEQKEEKPENTPSQQQKIVFKDKDTLITEQIKGVKRNVMTEGSPQLEINEVNEGNEANEEQEDDDRQIAYQNFIAALNIYQDESDKIKNLQYSPLDSEEVKKNIAVVHSRLGDLYMLDEKYQEAIDEYRLVIKLEREREEETEGWRHNRRLSEMHYMIGNCLLYANKGSCQKLAIKEFLKAVEILIKHLEVCENYNVQQFQLPNENQVKVDRFAYLPKPGDNEKVLEIKDVINALLDKLEDTSEQLKTKAAYQKEKEKMDKEKQNEGRFSEISEENKNVKVVSLGTFGNRKKKVAAPEPEDFKDSEGARSNMAMAESMFSPCEKKEQNSPSNLTAAEKLQQSQEERQNK